MNWWVFLHFSCITDEFLVTKLLGNITLLPIRHSKLHVLCYTKITTGWYPAWTKVEYPLLMLSTRKINIATTHRINITIRQIMMKVHGSYTSALSDRPSCMFFIRLLLLFRSIELSSHKPGILILRLPEQSI